MAKLVFVLLAAVWWAMVKLSIADDGPILLCEFNENNCGMGPVASNAFNWTHYVGEDDPTLPAGGYMLADCTGKAPGSTSTIKTQDLNNTGQNCVRFQYRTIGSEPSILELFYVLSGARSVPLWRSGESSPLHWSYAAVEIVVPDVFSLEWEVQVRGEDSVTLLDTVQVEGGTCTAPDMSCNFDFSLEASYGCSGYWTNHSSEVKKFAFYRFEGSRLGEDVVDHTTYTANGYFVMANFSEAAYANERTSMAGPVMPAGEDLHYCLTFWYQLVTRDFVSFRLTTNSSSAINRFQNVGDDTKSWVFASVKYKGTGSAQQILFYITSGPNRKGYLKLDDISVENTSTCSVQATCDFEEDTCGWRNTGEQSWVFYSLHPEEEGPPTQTHLIFVAPKDSEPGTQAILASPYVSTRNCFAFWFKKPPNAPATLKVDQRLVTPSGDVSQTLWSLPEDWDLDTWQEGQVPITIHTYDVLEILVVATRKSGDWGSSYDEALVSIDDITLRTAGSCPTLPAAPTVSYTTLTPVTPELSSAVGCDFTNGNLCSWTRRSSADGVNRPGSRWEVVSDVTNSYFVDPPPDDHGHWLAFRPSTVGVVDLATFSSPLFPATSNSCITFDYYMNGADVLSLQVVIEEYHGHVFDVWHRQGFQSDGWLSGAVHFSAAEHRIVFRTETAGRIWLYVAIDNIVITPGTCGNRGDDPALTSGDTCTFEESSCLVSQDCTEQQMWGQRSLAMLDHTMESQYGLALTLLSNDSVEVVCTAKLSPVTVTEHHVCLTFYHATVCAAGGALLEVYVESSLGDRLGGTYTLSGTNGHWRAFQVTVPYSGDPDNPVTFVYMKGSLPVSAECSIAVDDLSVAEGMCADNAATCDFEDHTSCLWTSDSSFPHWFVSTTQVDINGPGKQVDYGSRYLLFEPGPYHRPESRARLVSPSLIVPENITNFCLIFYYTGYGYGAGEVSVRLVHEEERTTHEAWTWQLWDLMDWTRIAIPFTVEHHHYVVELEGIVQRGQEGSFAVDNLEVRYENCPTGLYLEEGLHKLSLDSEECCPIELTRAIRSSLDSPSSEEPLYLCTFEDSDTNCTITIVSNAHNFTWHKMQAARVISPFRPQVDGDFDRQQHYLTTPDYYGDLPTVIASFRTASIEAGEDYCLSFVYHQTGLKPPTFYIQMRGGESGEDLVQIFHQIASQDDKWISVSRTLKGRNFIDPFNLVAVAIVTNTTDGDVSIDNFRIDRGGCEEPTDACHFYEGFCGFTQAEDDDINWLWHAGTGEGDVFVSFQSDRHDFYIYLDTKATPGSVARLYSPYMEIKVPQCLSVDVLLHGLAGAPGTILLWQESEAPSHRRLLRVLDSDQGLEWRTIRVAVLESNSTRLVLEGVLNTNYQPYAAVGLDEIRLFEGPCASDVSCTWEDHSCGWKGDVRDAGSMWQTASGYQVSLWTRPYADHTLHKSTGSFVFASARQTFQAGEVQRNLLYSPVMPALGQSMPCVSFWYHMYGCVGCGLYLHQKDSGRTEMVELLHIQNAARYDRGWNFVQASLLPTQHSFQLVLVVETAFNSMGDIAVDDFLLNSGTCDRTPLQLNYDLPPGALSCDFNNGTFCAWSSIAVTEGFYWKVGSSATVAHPVPEFDFSAAGDGLYAYADVYESTAYDSKTRLVANSPPTNASCLSFRYFLEGDHRLYLTINVTTTYPEILWVRNTPEPRWRFSQLNIESTDAFTLMFEVAHGRSSLGAVALDNLALVEGLCPEDANWCDFEASSQCNWTLAGNEAELQWRRRNFDHLADHTLQTYAGYALAVENNPNMTHKEALAQTSTFSTSGWSCVRWWCAANPGTLARLTVYYMPTNATGGPLREHEETVWSTSTLLTSWNEGALSVTGAYFKLVFGAYFLTSDNTSLVALDDVTLHEGLCELPGSCAFTYSRLCGWLVHVDGSSFWLVQHGEDHTFGDDYYLRLAGKEAVVTSPVIGPDLLMGVCLTFWYRTEQAAIIEWLVEKVDSSEKDSLWLSAEDVGTQGWRFGRAYISYNYSTTAAAARLVLRGTTEAYWEDAVVGVDDVELFVGACSIFPECADPNTPTVPTSSSTTYTPEPGSTTTSLNDCDFEDYVAPLCKWSNEEFAECAWLRSAAPLLSATPGPSVDHTTASDRGHFASVESTSEGNSSECVLYDLFEGDVVCLSFWYYMYGTSVQNLTAAVGNNSAQSDPPRFVRTGSQGDFWHHARLTFYTNVDYRRIMLITYKTSENTGIVAVDDLKLSSASCYTDPTNPSEVHDFEENGSGFAIVSNGTHDWRLNCSGVLPDHSLGTLDGHFAQWHVEGSSAAVSGAILSPLYDPLGESVPHCMHFYYLLDTPSQNASLVGYCIVPGDQTSGIAKAGEEKIFTNKISQGPNWIYQEATLHSRCSLQVKVEARDDHSPSTTIGIDDIYFTEGVCSDTYSCDFEHDLCFWNNEFSQGSSEEQSQWLISSPDNADFIGPSVDVTHDDARGHYVILSGSFIKNEPAGRAVLVSKEFPPTGMNDNCLAFSYNMRGESYLEVHVKQYLVARYTAWRLRTPAGSSTGWVTATANLLAEESFQVHVVGSVARDRYSYVAVDDLQFKFEPCAPEPPQASVVSQAVDDLKCGFSTDLCSWLTASDDTAPVTVGTSESVSGLSDLRGAYAYMTSYNQTSRASLTSPQFGPNLEYPHSFCFSFWFYNFGVTAPTVTVYLAAADTGEDALIFKKAATTRDVWHHSDLELPTSSDWQLSVRMISEYMEVTGVAAVDDTAASVGSCRLPAGDCDVEVDACRWYNMEGPALRWRRASPSDTPEGGTPVIDHDHTTGSAYGHYFAVQPDVLSQTRASGQKAQLAGPMIVSGVTEQCVIFWYYIDALSNSSLSVVREEVEAKNSSVQWSVQGNQGRSWVVGRTPIYTDDVEVRIIFEAEIFNNNTYAVLLDDILILEEACPESELACIFEDFCGYSAGNVLHNPWLIGRGVTERPQYIAGPTEDHTYSNGMYAYVDYTTRAVNMDEGVEALLVSELQAPYEGCFSFYWVKYANASEEAPGPVLSVSLMLQSSDTPVALVQLDAQNTSTTWTEQRVSLSTEGSAFRLVFNATASDRGSFIGIDDTQVWSGSCDQSPSPAPSTFPGSCDFEDENKCGFQDEDLRYQWLVGSRANLSELPLDHTTGSDTGKVMYRRSEGAENERAAVISQPVHLPQACVSFYFYNSPPDALKLQVYKKMSHRTDEVIGNISTPVRNWLALRYYVEESEEWQLKLVVESFLDEGALVAVDDLTISEFPCEARLECDFEESSCLWEPDSTGMWARGVIRDNSELEPGFSYSPSHDHSTFTEYGSYLYFYDTTNSSVSHDTVTYIYSETIPAGGQRCFQAWVYMNGDNVGELSLNLLYPGGGSYRAMTIDPDLSVDQWRLVQIDDDPSMHWLYFEARGSGGAVDILAVDDTILRSGNCSITSADFVCRDGKTVPREKVCDYHTDCETEEEDERVCASCPFSRDACGWQAVETAVSPNMFYWKLQPLKENPEGVMVATRTESSAYEGYDAHMYTPETQHSSYLTCYMELQFRLFGTNQSDAQLVVRMKSDGETDWTRLFDATGLSDYWQRTDVLVGRVADRFMLSIAFEPNLEASTSEGLGAEVGTLDLLQCSNPLEPFVGCNEGQHFWCDNNQTCVPSSAVCDFNEDCVDGADEVTCGPGYCSFENHYEPCEWLTKGFSPVVASKTPTLPYRDHTVNQGFGSYVMDDGSEEYPVVYSPTIGPSEECEFGFYSSVSGNLNVKVVAEVVDLETQEVIHSREVVATTRRNFGWQRSVNHFSHDSETQIRVIGVNKWSEGIIALDDFFMSSKCDLTSNAGDVPVFHLDPGSCSSAEYECSDQHCIPYTQVCDFTHDCPEGEDESRCGSTDLSSSEGGWQDSSISAYRWERVTADKALSLGGSPPEHNHDGSEDDHYMWLFGGYAGTPPTYAALVSPEMGPTALTCKLSFYMFARDLLPFILVQVATAGPVLRTPVTEYIFVVLEGNWEKKEIHIGQISERFRVRVTAVKEGYFAQDANIDLFLDDFSFDGCSSEEPAVNGSFECDFTTECADLYQGQDDTADWFDILDLFTLNHHLALPSTPSGVLEADLLTWYRTASSLFCFSFRYKIQGGASLFILISDNGGRDETIWQRQHEIDFVDWQRVHLQLASPGQDFQLKIRGRTEGTEFLQQEVWLDDVALRLDRCPAELTCTFDEGDCGWHNDTVPEHEIPWLVASADTNTSAYAPSTDHSWMTTAGQYAMVDVQPGQDGLHGRLRSSENRPTSGTGDCFKFWFYLYNAGSAEHSVGELAVLLDVGSTSELLWADGDDTRDLWRFGLTTVRSTLNFSLVIQATRYQADAGTIAVDDLSIEVGECTNQVDCDFESGLCGWTEDGSDDIFWDLVLAQSGPHDVHVDHTLNTEFGHYIVFDSHVCVETGPANCSANLYSAEVHNEGPKYCFSGYHYSYNLDANNSVTVTVRSVVDNSTSTASLVPSSASGQPAWVPFSQNLTDIKSTFQITLQAFARSPALNMYVMLDDLLLAPGLCGEEISTTTTTTTLPPFNDLFSCDFDEGNTCEWSIQEEWFLTDGENDALQPWGPFTDHTTDLSSGHMLAVVASAGTSVQNVEVSSKTVTIPTDGVCFSFYYYLHGDADIYLALVVDDGDSGDEESFLAWRHQGEVDNQWHQAYYYVPYGGASSEVMFLFSAGYISADNRTGNIALDDILAHAGECSERDSCDFEAFDLCGWQTPYDEGTLWWLQADGQSSETASDVPPVDHTYGYKDGHFMYVCHTCTEAVSDPHATTYSPALSAPDQRLVCLELYYFMQGPEEWVGKFTLYVKPPSQSIEDTTPLWSTTGNRGANWVRSFHETEVEETFQIALVAYDNDTSASTIIAVDDLSWTEGSCPQLGWCDFESGTCGFTNDQTLDDYDWVVWRGDASALETGPNVDHTLQTDKGHYMLLDASVGTQGQQAILILSDIPPGAYCFKFFYYMYGENIGGLTVAVQRTNSSFPIFIKTAATGDEWHQATTEAIAADYFSLLVIGTVGSGPLGDIGFDDTSLEPTECHDNPDKYYCHDGSSIPFENECDFIDDCPIGEDESICVSCRFESSLCGWQRDESTDHIWALAHFSASFGKSLYVKEQVAGLPGPARIGTKDLHHAFISCTFIFWYRCNPENGTSARLSVSVSSSGGVAYVYHIVNEGNEEWKEARVEILDHANTFNLILEAETDASYTALTVDDTSMESCGIPTGNKTCQAGQYSCPNTGVCVNETFLCDGTNDCGDLSDEENCQLGDPMCDFEEDASCSWQQEPSRDDIDWMVNSGQTPAGLETYRTGPSTDHTTRLLEGRYFYITKLESNQQSYRTERAWLVSPDVQKEGDKDCVLRFHYYMYGANVQGLSVYSIPIDGGETSTLFAKSGYQGQKWIRGTATATYAGMFQFVIEGITADLDFVDIGIDDISLSEGCKVFNDTHVGGATTTSTPSTTTHSTTTTPHTTTTTTPYTKPPSTTTKLPTTTSKGCPASTINCGDEETTCVPGLLVCDSVYDCPNNADEQNCMDGTPCGPGFIYCGGGQNSCANRSQTVCDGIVQCPLYEADESICGECPTDYCRNGGACLLEDATRAPICSCLSQYYGNRCELQRETNEGLSAGAIVGIVFAVLLLLAAAIAVLYTQRSRFFRSADNTRNNYLSASNLTPPKLDAADDTAYVGPDLPLHHFTDTSDGGGVVSSSSSSPPATSPANFVVGDASESQVFKKKHPPAKFYDNEAFVAEAPVNISEEVAKMSDSKLSDL